MTDLLVQNGKIKNSGNKSVTVYNFGIPAYESKSGLRTCPSAGQCANGCYAKQGPYLWSPVAKAYEYRLEQTQLPNFYDIMSQAIKIKLKTAIRQGKKLYIRIHDSGDFYSLEYYRKWVNVFMEFMGNENVHFYAYTKQVKMFNALKKQGLVPPNLTLIYSEGGLFDSLINVDTDRHSRVFPSLEALQLAGYADAHENDLVATGTNHKIGLVYHGHKSKAWDTSAA